MRTETFLHTLSDGQPAKFSIFEKFIDGIPYYFAKVVGTDLDYYKGLSDQEQEMYFGVNVTDGNGHVVYYSNAQRLKADIIAKYGDEWLKTEL